MFAYICKVCFCFCQHVFLLGIFMCPHSSSVRRPLKNTLRAPPQDAAIARESGKPNTHRRRQALQSLKSVSRHVSSSLVFCFGWYECEVDISGKHCWVLSHSGSYALHFDAESSLLLSEPRRRSPNIRKGSCPWSLRGGVVLPRGRKPCRWWRKFSTSRR